MLSTAADVLSLAQTAPWVAVGVLALVAAAWVYRQGRRGVQLSEDRLTLSATRQGKRLGDLERLAEMLDLRRRQVEWELLDMGVELPYWPPDGPDQPRPRPARRDTGDGPPTDYAPARVPVPPLPADVGAHHRRDTA